MVLIIIRIYKWKIVCRNRLAAPRFGILNRTSLIDFNFAGRFSGTRWWSNAILNFGGHSHESLLHIAGILGRCFKEWNAQVVGVFLCGKKNVNIIIALDISKKRKRIWIWIDFAYRSRGVIDNFFRGQIRLVADQQFIHIFTCIALDFLKPLLNVVERFLICAIINYDDTMSSTIIWRCNLCAQIKTTTELFVCHNQMRIESISHEHSPYGIALGQLCPKFAILSSYHQAR